MISSGNCRVWTPLYIYDFDTYVAIARQANLKKPSEGDTL
jgi:hypothetical protein